MKKLVLLTMMLVSNMLLTFAQDDIILYIADYPEDMYLCLPDNQRVIIYAQDGCENFHWSGGGLQEHANPFIVEPLGEGTVVISYSGCEGFYHDFVIEYVNSPVPGSFTHHVWKHQGELTELESVGQDTIDYPLDWPYFYSFQWSTGETTKSITVTQTGTYSVEITGPCGTATRTFIVRDNVEIYRSGVDPATNKNRVLWQTTPEQAEYISSVKIDRDGMVVGTAPYLDGQFLDNIGSENAARIYRITGIASDGTECPIPSYRFGTFNTIISPDINNPSLMNFTWEDPFIEEGSSYSVAAYRIGRFNEGTGEFVAIDQLSAQVHLGKYNMDLFEGDYGIVAAVFNDAKNRDYEELAFSNRSDSGIVGVEENGPSTGSGATRTLTVYPNPANNVLFVETRRATSLQGETYCIMNPLGQTLMEGQITTEKQQIDVRNLPKGVYFITVGDATRKFVVE